MEAPTVPPQTPASRRLLKWVVAGGIGLVGVAVLALALNGRDHTLRLDELPEGVTAHKLGGDDVFIVRDGNDVRVFLSDARHLPGDTLWWCPNEQIFIEVEHGSSFDRQGRKIGGPAAGGLNQYEVRTNDGELIVDTDAVIVGGQSPRGVAPVSLDDADFSRPFNSGPGSFCEDPVASPPEAVGAR